MTVRPLPTRARASRIDGFRSQLPLSHLHNFGSTTLFRNRRRAWCPARPSQYSGIESRVSERRVTPVFPSDPGPGICRSGGDHGPGAFGNDLSPNRRSVLADRVDHATTHSFPQRAGPDASIPLPSRDQQLRLLQHTPREYRRNGTRCVMAAFLGGFSISHGFLSAISFKRKDEFFADCASNAGNRVLAEHRESALLQDPNRGDILFRDMSIQRTHFHLHQKL
jgi:hypothetical protein